MSHSKKVRKFGRNTNQRKALFRNLIESLIVYEKIETTLAKAKTIKGLVDKLVSKAKEGSLHARRQLLSFLPQKKAADKLVDEIAPRFDKRPGGFVKIFRLGKRRGDDAMMVRLEWTEKKKIETQKEAKKTELKKKLK